MTRLFVADVRTPTGPRPRGTVRAAPEAEAPSVLEARRPEDRIEAVAEPAARASGAATGAAPGDVRENPGRSWPSGRQAPAGT